ncbi:sigma-70 family RNA polymerase sigma factor [Nannocystis sp. RBIL2]|uniref:RNA polymerase sigma factor n=1 Tax=Nannocystis sp. RBIL2 TaxID=2996788 RepID=UPI00226DF5F6|nr:sigma-70 family RNA polymerase sigma factor [Nannocystis sp. RBIL2]MCY1070975.1 sigma-70 family RNA polymerase sigma factor [Nannocystis sp. RBIL2]
MTTNPTMTLHARVVRDHWARLKSYFRSKVPEPDCYDLVQQTLAELVKCDLAAVRNMKTYVMRVAHNVLVAYIDEHKAKTVAFDSDVHSVMGPQTSFSARLDKRNRILNALRSLPLAQQEAVELRLCEDLELTEIAEMMERGLATVKRYIEAGTKQLRTSLGGIVPGDPGAAVSEAYRAS